MTLYDYCISSCTHIDKNHPVHIMKLYESIFDGDCWYEPVFTGRFGDIPFNYLRCEFDSMFIDNNTRTITFGIDA